MDRRLLTQSLLTSLCLCCILTASFTIAADKPFDRSRQSISGTNQSATPISTSPSTGKAVRQPIALNAVAQSTMIGQTYYDMQTVYSMPRLVEHRNQDWIHFAWTHSGDSLAGFPNRRVQYSAYSLTLCAPAIPANGIDVASERSGFASIDVVPSTLFPIIGGYVDDISSFSAAYFDYGWGVDPEPLGVFAGDSPSDIYGHGVTGLEGTGPGNENVWPKIEMQIGTETVLHMVTSERNPGSSGYHGPVTMSYYRRVGAYGQGNGTWSTQRIIDSTNIASPVIAADPNSDRVAIAWIAPCEWYRPGDETGALPNDVYYTISDNQGADWASSTPGPSISHAIELETLTGGNITNYPKPPSKWDYDGREFAYCEVQALFDTEGLLHVVWGTRLFADSPYVYYNRGGGIYHWVENSPATDMVYHPPHRANPDDYACLTMEPYHGDIAYLSLSECANGNLYVVFSRFGSDDNPCDDYDHASSGKHGSGYIYMTTSDNGGLYWDKPQRITATPETPEGCSNCGCGYPQCHSEEYVSVARYSRTEVCGELAGQDVLDIFYVDDLAPGPADWLNGVKTLNPMRWEVTPCRAVEPQVCYYDDAGPGFGSLYNENSFLWVTEVNPDTTVQITMYNGCLTDNHYTASIEYFDGIGWASLDKTSGIIPGLAPGEEVITVTLTMPVGAPVPSYWVCHIIIEHEAEGSPRSIPVGLFVTDPGDPFEYAILATACKRIKIENYGSLSDNSDNASLDYIDDCDTFNQFTDASIYLYDGGPIVGRIDGADTLLFRAYSSSWADDDALRPIWNLEVDSLSNADYSYAQGECVTADTSVGCVFEYYVPKAPDTCEFIVQVLKFFSRTGSTLSDVYLGGIFDWDVPSDSGLRNGSGFDVSRNLIYQYGAEYNQDDSTEALCGQESSDRYAGVMILSANRVKNAMTIDNATYMYSSGPYGDAPLPAGYVYGHLLTMNGYSTYSSSNPDSLYTDLSTLITYGSYDLSIWDTISIIQILSTGRDGYADFLAELDKAEEWAMNHLPYDFHCCVVPGDANYDFGANVGDAVYIISYAFRGGPAPPCMNAADCNGDCAVNVGDAVCIVNYIFRLGAAPVCGCVDNY